MIVPLARFHAPRKLALVKQPSSSPPPHEPCPLPFPRPAPLPWGRRRLACVLSPPRVPPVPLVSPLPSRPISLVTRHFSLRAFPLSCHSSLVTAHAACAPPLLSPVPPATLLASRRPPLVLLLSGFAPGHPIGRHQPSHPAFSSRHIPFGGAASSSAGGSGARPPPLPGAQEARLRLPSRSLDGCPSASQSLSFSLLSPMRAPCAPLPGSASGRSVDSPIPSQRGVIHRPHVLLLFLLFSTFRALPSSAFYS